MKRAIEELKYILLVLVLMGAGFCLGWFVLYRSPRPHPPEPITRDLYRHDPVDGISTMLGEFKVEKLEAFAYFDGHGNLIGICAIKGDQRLCSSVGGAE